MSYNHQQHNNKTKTSSEAIKVVVRIRPLSSKEIQDGRVIIAIADEERGSIEVRNPAGGAYSSSMLEGGEPSKSFTFDAVFSDQSTQRKIYDTCAAPVVQSVLEGYNGTIFAYGQTGAGKTHTMEGKPDDPELRGIIPNAFQHIFDHVALKGSNETYLVRASYFEIYNEEIRDLLSTATTKTNLELRESVDTGVYVQGLSTHVVKSFDEIHRIMVMGNKNRSVGATLMNAGSSRSHTIFSIVIECSVVKDAASSSSDGAGRGNAHIRVGKLNLVDLAGSERQSKTGATGERLKEATKINLSLSALGNVISALVDGKTHHIPYRDSKLTRILQDSLGGNTKTVMCANAGPAEYNYDETISTLRYANRAKNIKNKPIINADPKDALLREYQDEISKLKSQLNGLGSSIDDFAPPGLKDGFPSSAYHRKELETERKQSAVEKKELEQKLREESKSREEIEKQRLQLQQKLRDMEAQLMVGGAIADKAVKQEAELRKAQQELIAKHEAELALARQMAEKEEANFQLNEQYSSLQEACQSITKKLKKLWKKYQYVKTEIEDLNREFQLERTDLLETIRVLNKQMKLKDLIIENFIPPKYVSRLDDESNGGLAKWDEAQEKWIIPRIDLAGNNQNLVRPIVRSVKESRPETERSRRHKIIEKKKNPRHDENENILDLTYEYPDDPVSINYTGPNASKEIRIDVNKSCDEVINTSYIWPSTRKVNNPIVKYISKF